jgi:uncharacterized membrane protein YqjE
MSALLTSLRRLLATVIELAQVRLELLGTELELEKRRLFDGLLWALAALIVLGVGLALLCGFVILLFWDAYRLPAAGLLTLLFLGGGVLLLGEARQRLRNPAGIFGSNLAELERDRTGLSGKGQHE